ncbi:MAG: molybdopterin synthase catalytic subunit MoaE [Orrella sp.]
MSVPADPFSVHVQTEPFDLGKEYDAFLAGDQSAGAVASFVGRVRDINDDQSIQKLELEHYPGMTEKVMMQVVQEAKDRWSLLGARVVHRVGPLTPGENIVLVLTASAHRHAALDACAFIMDHLKTRATFWKKEQTPAGQRWVKGRDSDAQAQQRWQAKD